MKHTTYKILRKAHFGHVDKLALLKAKKEEHDKFPLSVIDLLLESKPTTQVPWDLQSFTIHFQDRSPREKMDETVITFLLKFASFVKEEAYIRSFQKPESLASMASWLYVLRLTIQCTLALLYNVPWNTPEAFGHLEDAVLKIMHTGDESALRTLMIQLGIPLSQKEPLYPAEVLFDKLYLLHVVQWSGFTWRFLHWMAEADSFRGDDKLYFKQHWRALLADTFFRTLRCGMCAHHFQQMAQERREDLLNGNLSRVLFEMHNQVHTTRRQQMPGIKEPDYLESQYQEDAEFMRKGLVVPS